MGWDFPVGPVTKTPCFYCRGHGRGTLIGELGSCMSCGLAKKEKKKMERWDGFQNKGDLRAMVAESLPE